MKFGTTLVLVAFSIFLLAQASYAWNGDTWGTITRPEMIDLAEEMIESTWSPNNTISNYTHPDLNPIYTTFNGGTQYTGIAYYYPDVIFVVDDWDEFLGYVNRTEGGTTYFGNDCSGFVSICWKLDKKYSTAMIEADADDRFDSLGSIGSGATANLIQGDALNRGGHHIVLYDRDYSSGIKTLEQTPGPRNSTSEMKRYWTWAELSAYRPMRRKNISGSITVPTVSTKSEVMNITSSSAQVWGEIEDDGGDTILERRIDWHLDYTNNVTVEGDFFYYTITGLSPDTTYSVCAWAKNSAGWGEGLPRREFTTLPENAGSPELAYRSYQIDDDSNNGSDGDGDGNVEPGEDIELLLTLKNTGDGDAHGITAYISTNDSYVTISDDKEYYDDINAGNTAECNSDFDFEVDLDCPPPHVITFTLDIQSDEGSWSDTFTITVQEQDNPVEGEGEPVEGEGEPAEGEPEGEPVEGEPAEGEGEPTSGYHPADSNTNWSMAIAEVTAYGAAWKQGDPWPVEPTVIPIDYVTNAGFIWTQGETYCYEGGAAPNCWVNCSKALWKQNKANSAIRTVSGTTVSISVSPDSTVASYAVEELLPTGLSVSGINEGGNWDAVNRKVKWGPFFDNSHRTLTYTVSGSDGSYTVSGTASFDGDNVSISGDSTIDIGGTGTSTATRSINNANVSVSVSPDSTVASYAVEELLPTGLSVSGINEGGNWDAVNRKVKWGPFFDSTARTLRYTVAGSNGTYTISGTASFDGHNIAIGGDNSLSLTTDPEGEPEGETLEGEALEGEPDGCVDSPYSDRDSCYQQVILKDPYCCDTAWDGACQEAYNLCVGVEGETDEGEGKEGESFEGEIPSEGEPHEGEAVEGEEEGESEGEVVEGDGEPSEGEQINTTTEAAAYLLDQYDLVDTDNSGLLNYAEVMAALPGLTRSQFNELDRDHNGYLSQAELQEEQETCKCGCGSICCRTADTTEKSGQKMLGDWLLLGMSLLILLAMSTRKLP